MVDWWSADELERRHQVDQGLTVVANQRRGKDEQLIKWAKREGLLVKVDRSTKWGNPFEMQSEADRHQVCEEYGRYLLGNSDLLSQVGELRNKVLLCWCHPKRCHGHTLANLADQAS